MIVAFKTLYMYIYVYILFFFGAQYIYIRRYPFNMNNTSMRTDNMDIRKDGYPPR